MTFEDGSTPSHDPVHPSDPDQDFSPGQIQNGPLNPQNPAVTRRRSWLPRIEPSAIQRRELRVLREPDDHPVLPNSMVASFLLHGVALAALFFIPVGSLLTVPRRGSAAENIRVTFLPSRPVAPAITPEPTALKTPELRPAHPRRLRPVVKTHKAAIQPLKKPVSPRPARVEPTKPPRPTPVVTTPTPRNTPSDHPRQRQPTRESTILAQSAPDPGAGGRPVIRRHIRIASRIAQESEPLFEAPTAMAPPPAETPPPPTPHARRPDQSSESAGASLDNSADLDPAAIPSLQPERRRHALHARMGKDKGWAGAIGLPGAGKARQLPTHGSGSGPAAMVDTTAPVSVHAGRRQESAPSADLAVAEAAATGNPALFADAAPAAADPDVPAPHAPNARQADPTPSDAADIASEIADLPFETAPGGTHARSHGDSTFSPAGAGDTAQNQDSSAGQSEQRRDPGPAAEDPAEASGDSDVSEPVSGVAAADQDAAAGPKAGGAGPIPALGEGGEGEAPGREIGSGFGGSLRTAVMGGGDSDLEGNYTIPGVVTSGDYNWHIDDLAKLLGEISDRTDVKVRLSQRYVMLGREPIRHAPLLVFTGHRAFTLTEDQREALRQYVAQGGMIWGDDSLTVFDESFRQEMIKTFGAEPEALPLGSAIYQSHYSLDTVPPGDFGQAHLFEGIRAPGSTRLAVVITRNRYFACMDGPPYSTETAQRNAYRVGTNIFFYAVRHFQQTNGA